MAALNPLRRWQRRVVDLSGLLLLATGLAWWLLHYGGGSPEGLPDPLEATLMRLHGAGVVGGLFAAGLVGAQHVASGWRMQRHRRSGALLVGATALLAASGYALYYWLPEDWRAPVGHVHTALGALMAGLLGWHRRRVGRTRRPL